MTAPRDTEALAREQLLRAACIDANEPSLQASWLARFPPSKELSERLAGPLSQLRDGSPKARLDAAKRLARELTARPDVAALWVRDPRATDALSFSLSDSDAKVLAELAPALAWSVEQHFPDLRLVPRFAPLVDHPTETVRQAARQALSALADDAALGLALARVGAADPATRAWAIGMVGSWALKAPRAPERLGALRAQALEAAGDPDEAVRGAALGALRSLGDAGYEPSAVQARARSLAGQGALEAAKELLLCEGYVHRQDPLLRGEYLALIPPSRELSERLSGPLSSLTTGDPAARREAAKALAKELCRSVSAQTRRWARDPRAVDALVAALDPGDPKLLADVATALDRLVRVYLPDLRARSAFAPFLESPVPLVRTRATDTVRALTQTRPLEAPSAPAPGEPR